MQLAGYRGLLHGNVNLLFLVISYDVAGIFKLLHGLFIFAHLIEAYGIHVIEHVVLSGLERFLEETVCLCVIGCMVIAVGKGGGCPEVLFVYG